MKQVRYRPKYLCVAIQNIHTRRRSIHKIFFPTWKRSITPKTFILSKSLWICSDRAHPTIKNGNGRCLLSCSSFRQIMNAIQKQNKAFYLKQNKQVRQKAKFLPHFHRKLSQKLLTDCQNRSIMYDNKSQRRSSHVYEQVLLLLLCHGLPDFCEIREVRTDFRNNKNTVSPHSSCHWGIELRIFIFS